MENKGKNINKRCNNILFVNNKIKKTKCFPNSFSFFYFFSFVFGPLTITTVDITKPENLN